MANMQVYYEVDKGRLDLVLTVYRDVPPWWGDDEICTRRFLDVFLEKRYFREHNKGLGLANSDIKLENRRDRLFLSKKHHHIYTGEGKDVSIANILEFLQKTNITYREGIPDYIKEAIGKYSN